MSDLIGIVLILKSISVHLIVLCFLKFLYQQLIAFQPVQVLMNSSQLILKPQKQQNQLLIKQQYFRTHITPEDYNSFSDFCLKSKGNLDIVSWTIEEVRELVNNFQFWKQYFPPQKPQPVDFASNKKPQQPHITKIQNGSSTSPRSNSKTQNLEPQIIHVRPKQPSTPQKKSSIVLSATQVMDLLTFTPQRSKSNKKNTPKVQNSHPRPPTPNKSSQKIQNNPKKQIQIPSIQKKTTRPQIIKLQPISEIPIQAQKRYSEPSLSSSQILSKSTINIPKIYKEQFEEIIKCKTPEKASLQNIKSVVIKKHQIVHKAFFLPDYVMYHVLLQPINIVCKRNYDDFKRLHDTLEKFYPGSKLPYLESNSWLSQTNIEFIKKQKICLQYFLNELIRHESFRDSFALYQFLTVTDHKSIKRKFEQYDEIPLPKSIENIEAPDGFMKIKLLNSDHLFIQKASNFSQEITQFLNQYNDLTFSAISNYDALIGNMSAMSNLINNFKKKADEFREFEQKLNISLESQLKELPEALKVWEKLINSEYSSLCSKKEILFQKVEHYTKYQQANVQSMDQLLYKRTEIQQNYLYQVENQPTSPSTVESKPKPKGYLSPEMLPHKQGLLEISQNLTVSKYHLAYLNTKIKQEFILEFESLGRGLRELLHEGLTEFSQKDKNQFHSTIENLIEQTSK